jgi:hypothetical protein
LTMCSHTAVCSAVLHCPLQFTISCSKVTPVSTQNFPGATTLDVLLTRVFVGELVPTGEQVYLDAPATAQVGHQHRLSNVSRQASVRTHVVASNAGSIKKGAMACALSEYVTPVRFHLHVFSWWSPYHGCWEACNLTAACKLQLFRYSQTQYCSHSYSKQGAQPQTSSWRVVCVAQVVVTAGNGSPAVAGSIRQLGSSCTQYCCGTSLPSWTALVLV